MAQAAQIVHLHPSDRKQAESFRDLEGALCELSLMARLASREIEGVLEEVAGGSDAYERGNFAIMHLCDMIEALKCRYYAEFAAAR